LSQQTIATPFLGRSGSGSATPRRVRNHRESARHFSPEALDRLIELYTAINQPDEAKKWQAERAKYPAAGAKPAAKK
jgi:hypothetical protein